MDETRLLIIEDQIRELSKKMASLSSSITETKDTVEWRQNNQLLRPLDPNSRILIEQVTKDLRNNKITRSITSAATITPNCETEDVLVITAQDAAATIAAPLGNPTNTQTLILRIQDNGTARALTWNSIYRAGTGIALPTTTVVNKMMYVGFMYNDIDVKWDLLAYQDGF